MIKGTSGLSNARVDEDRAASTAEVIEASRIFAGTNADARLWSNIHVLTSIIVLGSCTGAKTDETRR